MVGGRACYEGLKPDRPLLGDTLPCCHRHLLTLSHRPPPRRTPAWRAGAGSVSTTVAPKPRGRPRACGTPLERALQGALLVSLLVPQIINHPGRKVVKMQYGVCKGFIKFL